MSHLTLLPLEVVEVVLPTPILEATLVDLVVVEPPQAMIIMAQVQATPPQYHLLKVIQVVEEFLTLPVIVKAVAVVALVVVEKLLHQIEVEMEELE